MPNYINLLKELLIFKKLSRDSLIPKEYVKYEGENIVFDLLNNEDYLNLVVENKNKILKEIKELSLNKFRQRLTGWRWRGNSCWMDTLFVNLIGMDDSPFIKIVKNHKGDEEINKILIEWINLLENASNKIPEICLSSQIRDNIIRDCKKILIDNKNFCDAFGGRREGITNQLIKVLFTIYGINYEIEYAEYKPVGDEILKNINYVNGEFYINITGENIKFEMVENILSHDDIIYLINNDLNNLTKLKKKELIKSIIYSGVDDEFYMKYDPKNRFNLINKITFAQRRNEMFAKILEILKKGINAIDENDMSDGDWNSAFNFLKESRKDSKIIFLEEIKKNYDEWFKKLTHNIYDAIKDDIKEYDFILENEKLYAKKLSPDNKSNRFIDYKKINNVKYDIETYLKINEIKNINNLDILVVSMEDFKYDGEPIPIKLNLNNNYFKLRGLSLGSVYHYTSIISDKYENYFSIDVSIGGNNQIIPFDRKDNDSLIANKKPTNLYYYRY